MARSNADKIRAYVTAHPDAKPADVAAKFKTTKAYVYIIRSKMKDTPQAIARAKMMEEIIGVMPPMPDMTDMVNHPPHYKVGGIETIDFIEAKGLNYHLGNVVKYVARADHKGDRLENLKKAQWYLEREIAKASV